MVNIYVRGRNTDSKNYKIGFENDNLTEKINAINLPLYPTALVFLKMTDGTTPAKIEMIENNHIWSVEVTRAIVNQGSTIEAQLQIEFPDGDDVGVWQSSLFTFEVGDSINADDYIVQENPDYLEALDARVAQNAANAAASAASASTSASNAAESESNASTSASNAANSESAAAISESNAATSATNAAASAAAAATSESNAAASAAEASQSETNASASAARAAASESNASTSASNASTSASNAATSESNASASATSASTSASNAAASESNAATSAAEASQSAEDASDFSILAESLATSAQSSATSASQSAAQSAAFAVASEASSQTAQLAAVDATTAKNETESIASHPPTIGDDSDWLLWNEESKSYVDSNKPSRGVAATVTVGTTTTGAAGSNAVVTNVSADPTNAVFDFTIPQGIQGNVMYATFEIDENGDLIMMTPPGYTGASFVVTDDGHLEVIVNG